MNILFLSPIVPYPVIDGDKQRAFYLLRALATRHQVHFLGFVRTPADAQGLQALRKFCASAEGVKISRSRLMANCLRAWPGAMPLNVAAFASLAMRRAVAEIIPQHQIDCVHAYRLRMAPYALEAKVRFRVLDYTDAMVRHYQNQREVQTGWRLQWYLGHEIKRLRAYEVEVSHRFDAAIISSDVDRKVLQQLGASPHLTEVTNGVDTRAFQLVPALTNQPILVFLGNLEYAPNAWGLENFCLKTWPLVLQALPKAELLVIGKPPAKHPGLRGRNQPRIRMLGIVPDVKKYLRQARVGLCPLEVASGRQFKVIEYFAAGVPAMVTSVVAGNLGARDGNHCLVADTPQSQAAAIVKLCQDTGLANRLRKQARRWVEKKYAWTAAAQRMLRLYQNLGNTSQLRSKT